MMRPGHPSAPAFRLVGMRHDPSTMRRRCTALAALLCALAAPAAARAESYASVGKPGQIAWVRRAAGNFLDAEIARNGEGACAILEGRLRTTVAHRTCAQRWNAQIAATLAQPGGMTRLRADRRAVARARVVVSGSHATIALPTALLDGASRFRWTEACWMLTR